MADFDFLREKAESFLEELSVESYRSLAGLTDHCDLTSIFNRYQGLITEETFRDIKNNLWTLEGDARRRLEFLLAFAARILDGNEVKELDDEKNNFEANAKIKLPWGEESYRLSAVTLQNEKDRQKRKIIDQARRKVVVEENPIIKKIFDKSYSLSKKLGYKDYIDANQQIAKIDLYRLKDKMNDFLRETEKTYTSVFAKAMKEKIGVKLDDAEKSDVAYFFRAQEFDNLFHANKLLSTVEECIKDMGLDIYAHGNVRFDIEKREKKSPRAFCSALKIPYRIILVTMPTGGYSDYGAFLHELGHSLHHGYAKSSLEFEFRWLGDNSVTESFAFLIEHLLQNRLWLQTYLDIEDPDDFLRFAYLGYCYALRRYAAKITYELILHDERNLQKKDNAYQEILSRANLIKHPKEEYLVDVDRYFYCARYLRAWLFEANLSNYIEKKFGERWFQNKKTGAFLKELWQNGQKYRIEDLEKQLGLTHIDIQPLIKKIDAHLHN